MWTVKGRRKNVKKKSEEVFAMENLNKKPILAKIYCFNQLLFGDAVLLKRAIITSTVLLFLQFFFLHLFSQPFALEKLGSVRLKRKDRRKRKENKNISD